MPNENLPRIPAAKAGDQRWLSGHLLDVMRTERRLLKDLERMMLQQRAAIAAGDPESLDDATFGIERILRTLGEASRRPRLINRQLGSSEAVPLAALAESLGGLPGHQLLAARDDLRETARLLEDAVRTNQALVALALGEH